MTPILTPRIHVQDFHVDRIIGDKNELLQVLSQRYSDDANLFTLSQESLAYPWLNVYVRRDLAVLYYLPTEEEMFASVGTIESNEETIRFYDNEVNATWLSADAVICWSRALIAIEEFCKNLSRPTAIEWSRLN